MTNEEKQHITDFRVMIVGTDEFIRYIKEELKQIGFEKILYTEAECRVLNDSGKDIIIEHTDDGSSQYVVGCNVPMILPFDFIKGAGAIVLFPGDERNWLDEPNLRVWVAEYMAGYCAFWNVEGCEWLYDSLPLIKKNLTSEVALNTAAYICARIAANIAVDREVKHYPRFYLCRNLE